MPTYSELMAEMVARARPPHAPGQTLPRVLGGGLGRERATAFQADIKIPKPQDIEALGKLFGRVPTDELTKHVAGIAARMMESGPEEQQRIMNDPWTQATLELLEERGVPLAQFGFLGSTVETSPGRYMKQYSYVPTLAEKAPPAARTEVSLYGPAAAASLAGRREELAAHAPVREAEAEERRAKAEAARAEAEYHRGRIGLLPQEAELTRMRMQTELEHQNLLREQSRLVGPELEAKKEEAALKRALIEKQMRAVDLEIAKIQRETQLLAGTATKEEQDAMLRVDKAFDDFRRAWLQKTAAYGASDELTAYREILELEGAVRSHISGMQTYVKDKALASKASERSIRTLFGILDREFERPTLQPGIIFGPSRAQAEQQLARRRYYVRMAAELLKEGNVRSPDLLEKLRRWAQIAGIPVE